MKTVLDQLCAKKRAAPRKNLDIVHHFSQMIGNPERAYPCIHVAGTNGKGSVSTKIAKALEYAGLKVGLFTSPHLFSYTERIVVNGVPISEEKVRKALPRLLALADPSFGFFDMTVFLAFEHFRDECVDIAVIETGIGGLFDTTNIITPLVSVITSIAMDHADLLGNSLEEIAFQKAGIIKERVPVVVGPKARYKVVAEKAAACQSPIFYVPFTGGFYDLENQAVATQALKLLPFSLPEDAVQKGLAQRPLCRFEQIGNVVFDVAHNPDGIARLIEAIDLHFPGQPFSVVVGMSKDKDLKTSLALLAKRAKTLYLVEGENPRAVSPGEMAAVLDSLGMNNYCRSSSWESLFSERVLPLKEIVVVCGTFYIMKQAREALLGADISSQEAALSLR